MTPPDYEYNCDWDLHGVHCWSCKYFPSYSFIEKRTVHIACVERRMIDDRIVNFNFRKYVNRFKQERFVMIDIDELDLMNDTQTHVYITDGDFFRLFCEQMLKTREITKEYYDVLIESIGPAESPSVVFTNVPHTDEEPSERFLQ